MSLQNYVNRINQSVKEDSSSRTNVFDPKLNDGIINCYNIMERYRKAKKEKDSPIPERINCKKRGEKVLTSFKFNDTIDASTLDEIVDDLKLDNIQVDDADGGVIIEIEN